MSLLMRLVDEMGWWMRMEVRAERRTRGEDGLIGQSRLSIDALRSHRGITGKAV